FPTMSSSVPGANRRPSTILICGRTASAVGSIPRIGTVEEPCRPRRCGRGRLRPPERAVGGPRLPEALEARHHDEVGGGERATVGADRHGGVRLEDRGPVAREAPPALALRARARPP